MNKFSIHVLETITKYNYIQIKISIEREEWIFVKAKRNRRKHTGVSDSPGRELTGLLSQ